MINILGQLFALLTSACWAHNSLAYAAAGRRVGSDAVTHIRLWIAFPVIILVNLIFTGTILPPDLLAPSFFFLAVSGVVGFFLADIFIFRAFVDLGPRETLVILTLSPMVSALFSWILLGEALLPLQILGIFVTLGGVMAVTLAENRGARALGIRKPLAGLIFALLGTLSQSAAMILSKQGLEGGIHPVTANQIRIGFGLVSMVLYTILRGTFFSDFRKMKDRTALRHITTGALIGPVLGIILTLYALRLAPVGIATTLMQMSPVLLLPVERFVFHKKIPAGAVAGTLLAVMGAVMLFIT